ncbi:hypothetical protein E5673_14000 [Sphingomonas sp. PAMC26645]|uniref:hypothetical protein n=1 Tax=Sphingomonas sp. PAMC26645 TaxID=2565555 RepID=UPI00109D8848|nr:hypothetical protein [Sphingomonas sp. PAMC26645]QCB43193.1 hypothetical protein E5673_14000 [Sphingomonas sp. PAMC26645]
MIIVHLSKIPRRRDNVDQSLTENLPIKVGGYFARFKGYRGPSLATGLNNIMYWLGVVQITLPKAFRAQPSYHFPTIDQASASAILPITTVTLIAVKTVVREVCTSVRQRANITRIIFPGQQPLLRY